MTDSIIDFLIQILLNYFSPLFLALNLAIGVVIFFVYFYGTKHWGKYGWDKRIIISLLLGFLFVGLLTAAFAPLSFLFQTLNAEGMVTVIIYLPPLVFLTYLVYLRGELGNSPLCSERAKDHFSRFLSMHRSYWPYFMMGASLVGFSCFYVLFKLGNPYLSDNVVFSWGQFLLWFNLAFVASYLLILWVVILMSSPSGKVEPFEIFGLILKSCFTSFQKEEMCVLRMIEMEKERRSSRRWKLPHINSDFFQKLILILLFVTLLFASDKAFQIVNPAVQALGTRYNTQYIGIAVLRFWNGSLLYTIQVEKTFWINLPMILTRNLNITIQNPSNLSISKDSALVSVPYNNLLELTFYPDKALSCTPITDPDGKTLYLEVMPMNSSLQVQNDVSIKLIYSDVLDIHPIDISGPDETRLSNGSIAVVTSLFINNTEEYELYGGWFPLFQTSAYGNLTSYASFVNGTEQPSTSFDSVKYDDWLWFQNPLSVPSKSTMNVTVAATFLGET